MKAYIWDVNWVIYFGSVCLGGELIYRGRINGSLWYTMFISNNRASFHL